jgi:hypothetical protein
MNFFQFQENLQILKRALLFNSTGNIIPVSNMEVTQMNQSNNQKNVSQKEDKIQTTNNTLPSDDTNSYKKLQEKKRQRRLRNNKNADVCFKCELDDCDDIFYEKSQLMNHIDLHNEENIFECTIENCGKKFKDERNLEKHNLVHNPSKKTFQCKFPGCSKKFTAVYNLKVSIEKNN